MLNSLLPQFLPVQKNRGRLQIAARAKQEATRYADAADLASAHQSLNRAKMALALAPSCASLNLKLAAIDDLATDLDAQNLRGFRKSAKYKAYLRSRGASQKAYGAYQQKKQAQRRSPKSDQL